MRLRKTASCCAAALMALMTWMSCAPVAIAQVAEASPWPAAPPRPNGEGDGPFHRLVIEGGLLINGAGFAPYGPVTIVIERNRIVEIRSLARRDQAARRPEIGPNDKLIDARGSYILPGFVETHTRIHHDDTVKTPTDYVLKLLLAHGITTTTAMQEESRIGWALELQKQSAQNQITSPRIQVWADLCASSPEEIRAKIRQYARRGVSGIGEGAICGSPAVKRAGLDEAKKLGLPSMFDMDRKEVPRFNALDAARAGLGGLNHFYGLPEALLDDRTLPHFPADYNWSDFRARFQEAGRLWQQAAKPYTERWNKVLDELLALDFTLEPTFSVYEGARDYMGARRAEWHDEYLHPQYVKEFEPRMDALNGHQYDWTTTDEVEWKNSFRLWMTFVNEYKNRGGRVVAGDDPGYLWSNYGFGFIRNLEMLQEAGFTPLEVISSATLKGAQLLKMDDQIGSIEVGKLADLVIVEKNPLENLKVLYGTGVISLNNDVVTRAGGVKYTIKDGIVFDAKALLADVRTMVKDAKAGQTPTLSTGGPNKQPGS